MERETTVLSIDWFNDIVSFDRLDLTPPYQRYSVWSKSFKQYFIDTIINNFPSPAIFLHKDKVSPNDYKFNVVDGQQRLRAIFEFQENKFPLGSEHPIYPGKYFDELPKEIQMRFGNYKLPIEILNTESKADLNETFDRLNRNVRRLNKQELRHAKFEGAFISLMEILVDDPFWTEVKISTKSRSRDMRDIEYVSEIFILTMHGSQDSSPKDLDQYYADYDDVDTFPREEAESKYYAVLKLVKELGVDFLIRTRFHNLNDFYSLWGAISIFIEEGKELNISETRKNLEEFHSRVEVIEDISQEDKDAFEYSDAVRQGANKKKNRVLRANILGKLFIVK